jgi:predicted RNA-binding protein YlxR (DUF448 family)
VCREKAAPDELVRLVLAPDGQAVVDFRGKLPGRGAWVHPEELAVLEGKSGLLKRAFKQNVPAGPWVAQYREALHRAVADGLSMAAAAGALASGHDVLVQALRDGEIVELAFASDCSDRTRRSIEAAAADRIPRTVLAADAATLGGWIGRGSRAAVGVRSSRAATHLLRQLRRARRLG